MARVIFEAPQETLDLFVEAACSAYKYSPTVPNPDDPLQNVANPQTPGEFAMQCIISYAKEVTVGFQIGKAREEAVRKAQEENKEIVDKAEITASVEA